MTERAAEHREPGARLLDIFDDGARDVYAYVLARTGSQSTAEELTSVTFLAAVDAVRREGAVNPTVGWLIGIARHKLVDHWRAAARQERSLRALAELPAPPEEPWDARLDAMQARDALARLGPHHQAALTLRYLDDLPVPEVAALLGRTVHATEALLVRARSAFRRVYTAEGGCDA